MRILFLNTHLNTGGITSYLLTLSKGLRKSGHDVVLATSGGNCQTMFQQLGCTTIELNIRTKSELSPKIYFSLNKLKQLIIDSKIDVIHSHTRITQVMGEILSRQTGRPHVTTCHGYFRPNLGRKLFPGWGKRTIAISKEVKEHLINDFHRRESDVELIPSGVDVSAFRCVADKSELRKKFGLGHEVVIGIIARLSDVKGIDVLINAMSDVLKMRSDVKLLIVGEGKEEAHLKQLTQTLNLSASVKFLPIVNNTSEILSMLDIFAMPSRQEGLGLSIMEAQASSLPVVASDVGGIPTLIQHHVTGILVPKEDPRALAHALIELVTDKDKRLKLGSAAREFVVKNYSSERMVDATIHFYQSVMQ